MVWNKGIAHYCSITFSLLPRIHIITAIVIILIPGVHVIYRTVVLLILPVNNIATSNETVI